MNKLILAFAILASFASFANAQEAPAVTYIDVLRTCGAEWKESDTRKNTPKGEGSAAWNAFRVECVARKGYVTKNARKADFVRVPDKAN
jgi:hypothetical protein